MAAEDPSDLSFVSSEAVVPSGLAVTESSAAALPEHAREWLVRRFESPARELTVAVSASAGRWSMRVDQAGGVGSFLDMPASDRWAVGDLATALRRWARAEGHSVRSESVLSGEVSLAIAPAAAHRS